MQTLELTEQATLDPARVAGATDIKLSRCAPTIVAHLPSTVEKLSFSWSEIPNPLRLGHLPNLKSLSLIPFTTPSRVAIDELPPGLEKLDIWASVVERLPDPLPPLHELRFDCCDTRAVHWERIPATLRDLVAVRCELPDPLQLPELPLLKFTQFHACNLKSARKLLESPSLAVVAVSLNPLDDETLAALKALAKRGVVDAKDARPAKFELTRQLYAAGVNLSAEKQGAKKILLHLPMMSVCEAFPTNDVMALVDQVQQGKTKFSGQAFVDELRRQRYAARAAEKAAKKAAKAAAKAPRP